MLQTCNEFPVLGTLDMSSYFHTKSIIQLVEDLIFNSIRNFFLEMLFDPSFHDHAYHLVGIFDILIVEINLQEIMMSINIQKVNFISNVFFEILSRHSNLLFWEIWECLTIPIPCLSACKKINCITHFFLNIF